MKIPSIPRKFSFFVVTNLTVNFVGFLHLPDQVYQYDINELHYRIVKCKGIQKCMSSIGMQFFLREI